MDAQKSPHLQDAKIRAYNEGTEDSQHIEVILTFDKDIKCGDDALKDAGFTVSGEKKDDVSARVKDGRQLVLDTGSRAVERGTLKIAPEDNEKGYPGILDKSGDYCAYAFTLEALVPSGVSLKTVSSSDDAVTKEVKGRWNIRCITWVQLTDGGKVVESRVNTKGETMDGAVAVHGHDFLQKDETMIAEIMADTLRRHFGDRYRFSSSGRKITCSRKGSSGYGGRLDLKTYTYTHIN